MEQKCPFPLALQICDIHEKLLVFLLFNTIIFQDKKKIFGNSILVGAVVWSGSPEKWELFFGFCKASWGEGKLVALWELPGMWNAI